MTVQTQAQDQDSSDGLSPRAIAEEIADLAMNIEDDAVAERLIRLAARIRNFSERS